jgi:hypothetical protein
MIGGERVRQGGSQPEDIIDETGYCFEKEGKAEQQSTRQIIID